MFISDSSQTKGVRLSTVGTTLFEMGSKLPEKYKIQLSEINQSNFEGIIEYQSVISDYDKQNKILILKTGHNKYFFEGETPIPVTIYLGLSPDDEIRTITLKLGNGNLNLIKKLIDGVYGRPEVNAIGEMDMKSHQSFLWTAEGFDIIFSGIDGTIRLFYPPPKEYWEDMVKKYR